MGIREDREEFNNTGLRGLLKQSMSTKEEGYIRVLEGGWRGVEVSERPAPGSGPFLHFRRGFPVMEFSNSHPGDVATKEFRVEV